MQMLHLKKMKSYFMMSKLEATSKIWNKTLTLNYVSIIMIFRKQ